MWPGWDNSLDEAKEYASRAVELEPDSATALSRLAWIRIYFKDYSKAQANIKKAAEINPNNSEILFLFGAILNYIGEPEKALETLKEALSADSFVSPSWDVHVGLANILLGKFEDASIALDRSIERAPKYFPAYLFKAWVQFEAGQSKEVKDSVKTLLAIFPDCSIAQVARTLPFKSSKIQGRLIEAIRLGGLPEERSAFNAP